MQRGGRGSHGALFLRKHGLIIIRIALVDGTLAGDIGRQRHGARALEQQFDRHVAEEMQNEAAVVQLRFRLRKYVHAEIYGLADAQTLGVADEGLPAAQVDPLVQRCPDLGLAPRALQLRGNDLGIVKDQYVFGTQQLRQVADNMVGYLVARDAQQLRAVARNRRSQRDIFLRQRKVEKINAHRLD